MASSTQLPSQIITLPFRCFPSHHSHRHLLSRSSNSPIRCLLRSSYPPVLLHHNRGACCRFHPAASVSINDFLSEDDRGNGGLNDSGGGESGTQSLPGRLRAMSVLLRSILPGGSWWNLETGGPIDEKGARGRKAVTVVTALKRMWLLVAGDRWVIFLAFASLTIAAVSFQISIPNFLAASIFCAQSGQNMKFYGNARLLILLCITSAICSGLRGCCFGIANTVLVKRIREMLYSSLLFQDVSFFDEETVGDLTSRLGADCQQISRVIGNDLNLIFRNILQGTGALIFLFSLSWRLAMSTLFICSALATIMLFYGQYQRRAAKFTQEFTAYANEVAQETLSLIRTIRIYGTEKQEFTRYKSWLQKLADISVRQSMAYGFWNLSFNFLYHSTQVIAVLIGGIAIMSGHISAEQLTKFILYSEWLIYSTWWIGDNWSSLMQSIGASEKVFQLIDVIPSKQFSSEGLRLQKLDGGVEFVNVTFRYPSRPTVALMKKLRDHMKELGATYSFYMLARRSRLFGPRDRQVRNMQCASTSPSKCELMHSAKRVVAIVGLSGSGKSTIVSLLLRLYEPTSGQILVNGVPLRQYDIRWLRERIGFVGQEPNLFHMDVLSNIKYGCPRDASRKDVEEAAKMAFAHEFILSLPEGYETLVDDALLSGGQKQRIAIARAILRDPSILILDEATSALDAESEEYIKKIIRMAKSASQGRSVIVIAHRLSTVQAADRIVVMDGGKVVEMGDHSKLIQENGLYARLAKGQVNVLSSNQ